MKHMTVVKAETLHGNMAIQVSVNTKYLSASQAKNLHTHLVDKAMLALNTMPYAAPALSEIKVRRP